MPARDILIAPLTDDASTLAGVAAVYDAIWGQFGAKTEVLDHRNAPGFAGQVARTPDGRLVGYIYGMTARRGEFWTDRVLAHLAPKVAARTVLGSFTITELAVAPDYQRRGLGEALMRAVLADRSHPRATVSTHHDALGARAFYENLGFTTLIPGMKFHPKADGTGADSVVFQCALPFPDAR